MGLYPVLCMTSDGGKFCFCAMDVLRLGVSYSSMAAWAYVIMGGGVMFAVAFCLATPACGSDISRCRIKLSWILSLCSLCAVSVKGLVGPGLVCVGCPLGSLRHDVAFLTNVTILMLITSITLCYRLLPSVVYLGC